MPRMPDIAHEAWEAAVHRHHDQAPESVPPLSAMPPTARESIEIRAAQDAAATPTAPAITTAQEEPVTFASPIRHDLETVLTVLGGIAPRIIAVAEDKRVDELVEVALGAAGLGVADEVFAAATDALRAASARKAPAQPAPAQ